MRKIKDTIIAWTPPSWADLYPDTVGQVRLYKLGTLPHKKEFANTAGAAFIWVRELGELEVRHYLLSEFVGMVIRDEMDPKVVHKAFLGLEEYCKAIPGDIKDAL